MYLVKARESSRELAKARETGKICFRRQNEERRWKKDEVKVGEEFGKRVGRACGWRKRAELHKEERGRYEIPRRRTRERIRTITSMKVVHASSSVSLSRGRDIVTGSECQSQLSELSQRAVRWSRWNRWSRWRMHGARMLERCEKLGPLKGLINKPGLERF